MSGISSPNTIDLVTQSESEARLVLVEERPLLDEDAVALQEKLNNYFAFALDGGLHQSFPETKGKQVILRVDLYSEPSLLIQQFVKHYGDAVAQDGVLVELSVNGQLA